jgi:dihydropyrimidinase
MAPPLAMQVRFNPRTGAVMADSTITRRELLHGLALTTAGLALRDTALSGRDLTGARSYRSQGATELLIRGGRVVNADGIRDADVRIVGETIQEVARGLTPGSNTRVIEARGMLVMPGGIDPHTHLQPAFVDDLTSGSRAALAGGVTTVGTFAAARRDEAFSAALDRIADQVKREAIADVILHGNPGAPGAEALTAIPVLAERGHKSIKVFMVAPDFGARIGDFIRLLEVARDAGMVTLVHCEDGALLAAAVRRLQAEGKTSLQYFAESRPVIAEVAATQQAAALCEGTSAPMHVVHLSCARALDACRVAKANGAPLTVETRPLYLHLSLDAMKGPDAPLFIGQPPLRAPSDVEALWRGIIGGDIDFLATDHAPWTREQKMDPALTITRLRPGVSNLQVMLPMYFSEGVGQRKLPLTRFVATTSTNAARRFGLYPRKGVIAVGSQADVIVWDPARTDTVRAADDLSNSDYSIYEGRRVTGWPIMTIRRGEIVYDGGRVLAAPGSGRLLAR